MLSWKNWALWVPLSCFDFRAVVPPDLVCVEMFAVWIWGLGKEDHFLICLEKQLSFIMVIAGES